ncbi:MAG: hypothetical protein COA99_14230 [Moraxellaceae bacterium]|nr:MAG: hypothetical protein COA99_14230 [Moraxellaceae bacterium]
MLNEYTGQEHPSSGFEEDATFSVESSPTEEISKEDPSYSLSTTQVRVLYWTAQGLSNKQIGIEMEISPETVHTHFKNIFIKTSSGSRAQAVAKTTRYFNLDRVYFEA